MAKPFHVLKLVLLSASLAAPAACKTASPGPSDAATAKSPPDASASPDVATPPLSRVPITFACGRASGLLPGDVMLLPEQARPCLDPGYPQDIQASGVAGAESLHVIRRGECSLELTATERLEPPNAGENTATPALSTYEGEVDLVTPEGSLFRVKISPTSPACGDERALVAKTLRESLRVVPLQRGGAHVRADLSSAGHGFEFEAPPGILVVSSGGMADQYETAYQFRGGRGAWATLYTSWRKSPSSPPGPFVAELLPRQIRWRPATDLGTDTEGCRSTQAVGPDRRVKVELVLCGAREAQTELEPVLANIRLKPARR